MIRRGGMAKKPWITALFLALSAPEGIAMAVPLAATPETILERLLRLHPKAIDLSLGRMQRLLDALGNPERALPPVIHVAGTNGKGSTCAYLREIGRAHV